MVKLYTINGENQTIRVFILEKATKEERKNKEISKDYVIIQDFNTGQTATIRKDKLIFNQEFN